MGRPEVGGSFVLSVRQPDLSGGLCTSGQYPADWWTSDKPTHDEREWAVAICQRCR